MVTKTNVSIAGFDPSSGAGFTADLKVFAAFGHYGVACATALTVQSTLGVRSSSPVSGAYVSETLDCLSEDLQVSGIKIGMLGSRAVVEAVADWLGRMRSEQHGIPVVVDPVLRSSSGATLLDEDALPAFCEQLLPLATVITPNLAEAALLGGSSAEARDAVPGLAAELQRRLRDTAIVVTGGHLDHHGTPDDYLLLPGASAGTWVPGEWVDTRATHGTGCAFSSALLCGLVEGRGLEDAVRGAKRYVEAAMRAAYPVGHGRGPMHHLYPLSSGQ